MGVMTFTWDVVPFSSIKDIIDEISTFVEGHREEKTTLLQKIKGEINPLERTAVKTKGSVLAKNYQEIPVTKPQSKQSILNPKYFVKNIKRSPLVISDIERVKEGFVKFHLFDNYRQYKKSIIFKVPNIKFPLSDYEILDGGVLVGHNKTCFFKSQACKETTDWVINGTFHHYFSVADGKLWVFGFDSKSPIPKDLQKHVSYLHNMIEIDVQRGVVTNRLNFLDIAKANIDYSDILVMEWLKNFKSKKENFPFIVVADMWHPNDIDLLPKEIADQYPYFAAGDLLVSAKGYNLLFVLDPKSKKIKWHSQGRLQGQHDPDWIGRNKISVFNNKHESNRTNSVSANESSFYSEIVEFDFGTNSWNVVYNAEPIQGITRNSGGHDRDNYGFLIMDLDLQGRIVELDKQGNLVFEYINSYEDDLAMGDSGAKYISLRQFNDLIDACD